jgi:tRNA G18 (ribose-2'-O)-methylase SpoU
MNEQTDYLYGRNAVLEALASGKEIEKIFISFNSQGETVKEVFNKARVAKVT